MSTITAKEILWLNYSLTRGKGLPQGVREGKLIKAALLRPQSTLEGKELYPDIYAKAAALAEFIIIGRPFISLNTATAVASGLLLLQKGGYAISVSPGEIASISQKLHKRKTTLAELTYWYRSMAKPQQSQAF